MDKVEALRSEGKTRRQSHIGRRQSLTSSHVEQMKETLKERAAKYKEHAGEHLNTQHHTCLLALEKSVVGQFYQSSVFEVQFGPICNIFENYGPHYVFM